MKHVWVDMDGLAADDACEHLLETCIIRKRRENPHASKEYFKLLGMTQIAWAGSGGKSEDDGKGDDKSNIPQSDKPEENKEEQKQEETK